MIKKGKIIRLAEKCSRASRMMAAGGRASVKKKHYDYGQSIQLEYGDSYEAFQETYDDPYEVSQAHSYFSAQAFDNVDDRFEVESFSAPETPDEIIQYNTLNEPDSVALSVEADEIFPEAQYGASPRTVAAPPDLRNSFQAALAEAASAEDVSEDALSFQKDIQDILTGQKKYEGGARTDSPVQDDEEHPQQSSSLSSPPSPKGGHDVFEEMSKKMSTARSFDLGSIDLQNTFDEFDDTINRDEQKRMARARSASVFAKAANPSFVSDLPDLDYAEDLSAIEEKALAESPEASQKIPSPPVAGGAVMEKPQPVTAEQAPVATPATTPAPDPAPASVSPTTTTNPDQQQP